MYYTDFVFAYVVFNSLFLPDFPYLAATVFAEPPFGVQPRLPWALDPSLTRVRWQQSEKRKRTGVIFCRFPLSLSQH